MTNTYEDHRSVVEYAARKIFGDERIRLTDTGRFESLSTHNGFPVFVQYGSIHESVEQDSPDAFEYHIMNAHGEGIVLIAFQRHMVKMASEELAGSS